jgi:hypothetical protein
MRRSFLAAAPLALVASAALATGARAQSAAQVRKDAPAPATSAASTGGDAEARAEVLAVVKRLFDAMRAGDSAAVRAVFHPQVQMVTTMLRPDGTPVVRVDSMAAFLRAIGTPRPQPLDERTWDEVVHVDGPLASAWMRYALYVGPRFIHCGVDAFHMARTPDGWRIVSLADTRQPLACPPEPASSGTR